MSKKKKIIISIIAAATAVVIIVAGVTGGVLANKVKLPKDDILITETTGLIQPEYDKFLGADNVDEGESLTIYVNSLGGQTQAFLHIIGWVMAYVKCEISNNGKKFLFEFVPYYKSGNTQRRDTIMTIAIKADFYDDNGVVEAARFLKKNTKEARFKKTFEIENISKISVKFKIVTTFANERIVKIVYNQG